MGTKRTGTFIIDDAYLPQLKEVKHGSIAELRFKVDGSPGDICVLVFLEIKLVDLRDRLIQANSSTDFPTITVIEQ